MGFSVCGLPETPSPPSRPPLRDFFSTLEASHSASSEPAPGNHFPHLRLTWRATPGSYSDFLCSRAIRCEKLFKVFLNKESHAWGQNSRLTLFSSVSKISEIFLFLPPLAGDIGVVWVCLHNFTAHDGASLIAAFTKPNLPSDCDYDSVTAIIWSLSMKTCRTNTRFGLGQSGGGPTAGRMSYHI